MKRVPDKMVMQARDIARQIVAGTLVINGAVAKDKAVWLVSQDAASAQLLLSLIRKEVEQLTAHTIDLGVPQ